jgi:hypothetical protein
VEWAPAGRAENLGCQFKDKRRDESRRGRPRARATLLHLLMLDERRSPFLVETRRSRAYDHPNQGRASYTKLKGVSAARRKRLNPAVVTTWRMRVSPAWAPKHSPTS